MLIYCKCNNGVTVRSIILGIVTGTIEKNLFTSQLCLQLASGHGELNRDYVCNENDDGCNLEVRIHTHTYVQTHTHIHTLSSMKMFHSSAG